jgi:hypothetical protein
MLQLSKQESSAGMTTFWRAGAYFELVGNHDTSICRTFKAQSADSGQLRVLLIFGV